jgi:hypothetical protein
MGLALLTPALRVWHAAALQDRGRPVLAVLRGIAHALILWSTVTAAHSAYRQAYGIRMESPAGYMRAEGQMRLGLVAPLIRPEHFERFGLPPDFADELEIDLRDHRNREAQIWTPLGLWARLEAEVGPEKAQEVAAKLSVRALQSDPLALIRMGWATLLDYFDDEVALWRLQDDYGRRAPDAQMIERLSLDLRYDARGLAEAPGLVGYVFLSSRWWLTLAMLALAPLAVLCLLSGTRRPQQRAAALVVGFTALGLVASHFLFSHIVSFRYLHPMPVFLLVCLALGGSSSLRGRAVLPDQR